MFDKMRSSSSIIASFLNFNIDFWLTIPPMIVSLWLSIDQNIQLFFSMLTLAFVLIFISIAIDGSNCIVVPFWSDTKGNPRKAFLKVENKKISDIIKG